MSIEVANPSREDRIRAEVAAIGEMELEDLRALWRRLIGPPPKLRSVPFLRLHLAWRVQANAFGGLDAQAKQSLRKSGQRAEAGRPQVGCVLAREWQGVTHRVIVAETGFTYDGRSYRSLSVIAREITGARWNGPRFFGLRASPSERDLAA